MPLALPTRRALLGSATAALASAAMVARAAPAGFNPANATDRLVAFRTLAYSLDDKLTFNWLRGRRYALVKGTMYPLWDMVVGSAFRVQDIAGGGFEVTSLGASFYTDVQTGQEITSLINPVTGKRVEIFFFPLKPSKITFGPGGRTDKLTGPLASLKRDAPIGPAWVQDGDVYIVGDDILHGQIGAAPVHVHDLTTYFGKLSDVINPAIKNAPSRSVFNDVNSWPAWLGMGETPGEYFSRALGAKAFHLHDMPALWVEGMERRLPGFTRDPAGALKG